MAIFLLVAGLALLALAGDALVRGSVSIAERMHIPPIVVGLTIVAFGTSAPELMVSLEAALEGAPGLALGNVIGSNIANTTLVLGLPAIFAPLVLAERGVRTSLTFMIAISVVLIVLAQDLTLGRLSGALLFGLLIVYLLYSAFMAQRDRRAALAMMEEVDDKPVKLPLAITLVIAGIAGLAYGGKLTTDGALGVAEMFGLADAAVGLTIVALGTSLPELAASLAAALRRQTGVAVGNVIGSNVFNVLGILGITAMIVPLHVDGALLRFDLWVMLAASAVLVPFAFTRRPIGRFFGLLLTIAYLAYAIAALRHGVAH